MREGFGECVEVQAVYTSAGIARRCKEWRRESLRVGLVPTMGALHAGHMTLVQRARRECDRVVLSIYVNPAQFGPKEDLARYPRPRRQDLAMCREAGVDMVFAPGNLYTSDHSTWVLEEAVSQDQEGAQRPGHFRGVATVVLKLFHLVQPDRAYFGLKDFQQVQVIQRMVRDLNVPVKVVEVPTVREPDELALSSRNRYLTREERQVAGVFAGLLKSACEQKRNQPETWLAEKLKGVEGLTVDYCERVGVRLVVAVRVGATRLLDNRMIG